MNHRSRPLAATPPAAIPDGEELIARAWALAPYFLERAPANEKLGRLTDDVIDTVVASGFIGLMVPRAFGGSECAPTEILKIIEALCYGDGSTGWVTMAIAGATGTGAAFLPADTAERLFAGKIPLISGQGGPIGKAEKVDGGFILNGHWRYGSGVLHCQWLHNGAVVHENGEPAKLPGSAQPEIRIFVIPVEDAELLENWDVLGLRATGSIDYTVTDLFVPDDHTHLVVARRPNVGGDIFRLTIPGLGGILHTGFALGTARRVLDELAALARKDPNWSAMISPPGGNDRFHELFAHNEAKLRGARALAVEAQEGTTAAIASGRDPTVRETTLSRLSLNHATTVAAEICIFAYRHAGGVALRDSTIQRCLRDMLSGTQHATTSSHILRNCGKDLLGHADGKMWSPREIVDPFPFDEFRV